MSLRTVDAHTLKSWLNKGEAILVDVRESSEHGAQRIPGARLLNAGLTGWCGLALLMAKMPWNQGNDSPANFCMTKRS